MGNIICSDVKQNIVKDKENLVDITKLPEDDDLNFLKEQKKIILIQSFFRKCQARKKYLYFIFNKYPTPQKNDEDVLKVKKKEEDNDNIKNKASLKSNSGYKKKKSKKIKKEKNKEIINLENNKEKENEKINEQKKEKPSNEVIEKKNEKDEKKEKNELNEKIKEEETPLPPEDNQDFNMKNSNLEKIEKPKNEEDEKDNSKNIKNEKQQNPENSINEKKQKSNPLSSISKKDLFSINDLSSFPTPQTFFAPESRPGNIIENFDSIPLLPEVQKVVNSLGEFLIEEKELLKYIESYPYKLKHFQIEYPNLDKYNGYFGPEWTREGRDNR